MPSTKILVIPLILNEFLPVGDFHSILCFQHPFVCQPSITSSPDQWICSSLKHQSDVANRPILAHLLRHFIAAVFLADVILHSGSDQLFLMTAAALSIISMNILKSIAAQGTTCPSYFYLRKPPT